MLYRVGGWFYWHEGRLRHVSGVFSPVAATLNAWLVINEVGRGELVERMAGTVSFLAVC